MAARSRFDQLGVSLPGNPRDATGARLRVFSAAATRVDCVVYRAEAPASLAERFTLTGLGDGVFEGFSPALTEGASYEIFAAGPSGVHHDFVPTRPLIDPYARGLIELGAGRRAAVIDNEFDWGGIDRPDIPIDHTIIYELHVKGFSQLNPRVPEALRGTYAGLAHPASIEYLQGLGVTSVELLPIHAFITEDALRRDGRKNYWGYNTVGYFAPHPGWASGSARKAGPSAVAREVKAMIRALHQAGIEVILDVVYGHTAEGGPDGPTASLRGLDNASYYRQDPHGNYIDTTGCGNSLNAALRPVQNFILDSMRYWAEQYRVDGFRLDLAATLGRNEAGDFTPEHPLLSAMLLDDVLRSRKIIAEPWDVGRDGWQTGRFPHGFLEWNDRYRDRMRDFWLSDTRLLRESGAAGSGIGRFATRLAGSSNTFSEQRGPLAGINFITAHDGFTLYDLCSYDQKHNQSNGEDGRDGSDNNNSFNHGAEGRSDDASIVADRSLSMRNLFGTLLLSAGIPMILAGDEHARTQLGNNNAYCHDDETTWLSWEPDGTGRALGEHVRKLIALRKQHRALRPEYFARRGERVENASQMDWFNADGQTMTEEQWNDPAARTLQYLATAIDNDPSKAPDRILLIVHARDTAQAVTLPVISRASGFSLLWDSADETPKSGPEGAAYVAGGATVSFTRRSMRLFEVV